MQPLGGVVVEMRGLLDRLYPRCLQGLALGFGGGGELRQRHAVHLLRETLLEAVVLKRPARGIGMLHRAIHLVTNAGNGDADHLHIPEHRNAAILFGGGIVWLRLHIKERKRNIPFINH